MLILWKNTKKSSFLYFYILKIYVNKFSKTPFKNQKENLKNFCKNLKIFVKTKRKCYTKIV